MIDLHCHVLPGIDDGPKTMNDSVELARAAAENGIDTIVATPHVSWRYENEAATIAALVRELGERLANDRVGVSVRGGAEIAMTLTQKITEEELLALRLGGGEWLLVECPFTPNAGGFDLLLPELQARGHRILLAHPERCPAFQRDRDILRSLVAAGMLTSITAGALTGRFGRPARDVALWLVNEGLAHNVASDAHDTRSRPPSIAAELEAIGLGEMREWLTEAVPRAILDGEEIPARPRVDLARRTRGLGRWLRHTSM